MRTTLDLDLDIIEAAKALAKQGKTTTGRVISDTMRKAFTQGWVHSKGAESFSAPLVAKEPLKAYGFRPFTHGQRVVTNDLVRALRDESGD